MKRHSIVDQITNSSGTTYVFSDNECLQSAKDVLTKIMGVLGVEGNVDDYFNFKFVYQPWEEDDKSESETSKQDLQKRMYQKLKITAKQSNENLAPLMDSLFKSFNTYEDEMVFAGDYSYDWGEYANANIE